MVSTKTIAGIGIIGAVGYLALTGSASASQNDFSDSSGSGGSFVILPSGTSTNPNSTKSQTLPAPNITFNEATESFSFPSSGVGTGNTGETKKEIKTDNPQVQQFKEVIRPSGTYLVKNEGLKSFGAGKAPDNAIKVETKKSKSSSGSSSRDNKAVQQFKEVIESKRIDSPLPFQKQNTSSNSSYNNFKSLISQGRLF